MIARAAPPPAIPWAGAGCPIFIGDAGDGPERAPVRIESAAGLPAAFGPGTAKQQEFRRSLEGYFLCGGRNCYVFHVPGLDGLAADRVRELLGEDGGPGRRAGLNALSDLEDAGTIAAPGSRSAALIDVLLAYALRRRSRALVLEGPTGSEPPDELLGKIPSEDAAPPDGADPLAGERIAWLTCWKRHVEGGLPVPPSGPALGALERVDYDPRRPERHLLPVVPFQGIEDGIATLGGRFGSLRAWRRWEGLRRSLERGTRWALLEFDEPMLRPRLEREIRAFLLGLHDAGVLAGRRPEDAFEVRVRSSAGAAAGAALEIEVRVRIRDESAGSAAVSWSGRPAAAAGGRDG